MAETGGEYLMRQGANHEALQRSRQYLRRALELRFGSLPDRLRQEIEQVMGDVAKLEEAFERAMLLDKLEDFHW